MKFLTTLFAFFLFFATRLGAGALDFDTLSASFTQIIKSADKSIKYTGKFIVSNPLKSAFWEYDSPFLKRIYFNNGKVFIIEDELEQAIVSQGAGIASLEQILSQAKPSSSDTFVANYDDISYTISIKNSQIHTISYTDKLDNEVLITLENLRQNIALKPEIFTPVIPKGYDIISR